MRRPAIIASILTLLLACDKQTEETASPPIPLTAVSASSTVLFQVFGARAEPRAAPIAIVEEGMLKPIVLDNAGWRTLDSLFFRPGTRLPIYRDGVDVGAVEIVQGMWTADGEALYSLPGCREVVPQALLRLQATIQTDEGVEFLAASTPLTQARPARALPRDAESPGRTIASAVATASEIGAEELQGLEFIARWLRTGAGPSGQTLLASYIDPEAGDAGPGAGHTTMLLVLAEDSAGTRIASYKHVSSGDARTVQFQRLANHADLDGDGVDELILETWRYAGIPDLIVLKYGQGRWHESFRVGLSWCIDRPSSDSR